MPMAVTTLPKPPVPQVTAQKTSLSIIRATCIFDVRITLNLTVEYFFKDL